MSIKRRFEKWFYLDEEEEFQQEKPVREQQPVQGATAKKSGITETANC